MLHPICGALVNGSSNLLCGCTPGTFVARLVQDGRSPGLRLAADPESRLGEQVHQPVLQLEMAEQQSSKVLELGRGLCAHAELGCALPGVPDDGDRLLLRPWHQRGDSLLLDLLGPSASSFFERTQPGIRGHDLRF